MNKWLSACHGLLTVVSELLLWTKKSDNSHDWQDPQSHIIHISSAYKTIDCRYNAYETVHLLINVYYKRIINYLQLIQILAHLIFN